MIRSRLNNLRGAITHTYPHLSAVSPQKKHIVFHINYGPVERSCRTLPHGSSCSLILLYALTSVNFLWQLLCTKTILGPELRYSSRSGLFITGQKLKMDAFVSYNLYLALHLGHHY